MWSRSHYSSSTQFCRGNEGEDEANDEALRVVRDGLIRGKLESLTMLSFDQIGVLGHTAKTFVFFVKWPLFGFCEH